MRYCLNNTQYGILANVARNAGSLKKNLAHHAYTVQAVIELVKNRIETFEVEINEGTEDPKKLGKAPY